MKKIYLTFFRTVSSSQNLVFKTTCILKHFVVLLSPIFNSSNNNTKYPMFAIIYLCVNKSIRQFSSTTIFHSNKVCLDEHIVTI
ncbi:hypothetical protein BpHYR1_025886 [Brachionus plicatilis]|uniref:Uncharacterized protein n=1 Tax=Brachionus plicatilis TaxID=10195 RepID=A0A3M7Q7X6_BRAPC|nr:hypothetical protein BpHYR1_025886 [Brachionus plicatilis]